MVTFVKLLPEMTTVLLAVPETGVKLPIVGAKEPTVKLDELTAVPAEVVTERVPLVAPAGTVAVI